MPFEQPLLVEVVARVHHWTPGHWGEALRPSSKDTQATPPLRSLPAGESKRSRPSHPSSRVPFGTMEPVVPRRSAASSTSVTVHCHCETVTLTRPLSRLA